MRNEVGRRLSEVGLGPEVAGRYPFQLSGGMRQRVALAAALARDPEVLIADEPTTALDVTTQAEVLQLLKAIQQRRGMALILITHDLRVAFSVCDQIQVMYAGSVVEHAPARELMTVPAHPYSLSLLLAEPPVDHYVERLMAVPGAVPPADEVARTCAFAARCEWAQPGCTSARPPLRPAGTGRASACIRVDDIHEEIQHRLASQQRATSSPARPEKGAPVASLTDVRKTYRPGRLLRSARAVTALDAVGFDIFAGESVGLVGETGSGKTTIARTILGLTKPDSGAIRLGGIDASSYRALSREQTRQVRRMVQAVFQDPYASLNPALSVGSTLREVLEVRGDCADPQREVADLLGLVGLPSSYRQRRPALLSGGERQRVAIARAIALRPRLLICDEPVAALDVSAQAQVLELLRDLRRRYGMSMLFITHDLSVVRQMTDRIIVLYRGQIVETGGTAAVLGDPQHDYTRQLLEAVPGREAAGGEAQHQPPRDDGSAR
jgi:peptide/nickel transport system ATP-binding protein